MSMPALQASKHLCQISDWTLTNLSINKILYISNMIYMGRNEGRRLIEEDFQAWDYGPVISDVYYALKAFGASPVKNVFRRYSFEDPDNNDLAYLDWAYEGLKNKSPSALVSMTHWEEGAWSKVYKPGVKKIVIPDQEIMNEYSSRYG